MNRDDLEFLLVEGRRLNRLNRISGVLLHSQGNFMQCFEGPEVAVLATYERIKASERHKDLIELMNRPVPQRSFEDWEMGLVETTSSAILTISSARWQQLSGSTSGTSPGLELLRTFWKGADPGQATAMSAKGKF